ncbi:MAG: c-type cytochrome [Candidatus Lustribacter sp.]
MALALVGGRSSLAAQGANPVPGDYTAAQAAAGAQLYTANCSACHGADLHGPAGPALIGDAFTSQWTGEAASDPETMMAKNMPLNAPGTLKPSDYLAIMAYILQQNKYPAGGAPLTPAKLKTIKLLAVH